MKFSAANSVKFLVKISAANSVKFLVKFSAAFCLRVVKFVVKLLADLFNHMLRTRA